jgi:hypothetical protein
MFKSLTFGAGVGAGAAAYYLMKTKYPATPNYYSAIAGTALIAAGAFGVLAKLPIPEAAEEMMLGAGYALVGVSAIQAALNPGATAVAQARKFGATGAPMQIARMGLQAGGRIVYPGPNYGEAPFVY